MALFRSIVDTLRSYPDDSYGASQREIDGVRARVMLVYVGVAYPAFYGLDVLVYPQLAREFGLIRLVHAVFALGALALDGQLWGSAVTRGLAMVGAVSATLGVTLMCALTEGFASLYLVGVIICFLAISTIEIFRPLQLLIVLLSLGTAHGLLNHLAVDQVDPRRIVADLSFVAGAVLFCVVSAVLLERQRRQLFAANRRLLQQNAELERARQHQTQFLSTVSHELRSPVNSVLGFVELIEAREPALHEKSIANLRRMRESARRLLGFINDLLDLSKIEAGAMELHISEFDLMPIVHEVAEETRALVLRRNVGVEVRAPQSLIVRSDPARLRQILTNLASNAAKFTEHGQITLTVVRDPQVTVEVSDTGAGIPREAHEAVFHAFRQVGLSAGGTGLGLSIVRHLAQLLDARVELESEVGQGSTFRIRLGDIEARAAA